jgi:hypothetical protein
MIYELRTYTLHPGKVPAYLDLAKNVGRRLRGDDYGKCHGYWTAEFGTVNQVSHLWSFASLDERAHMYAELGKNERYSREYRPPVLPLLQRQDIRFMNPVVELKPPETSGGIYEIRIYRAQPGMAGAWAELLKSYLPVREKYSPIVGLWTGLAPQPNEAVHMWHYADLNARMSARAAASADPEWQEFLGKGAGMLAEMQSVILLPTSFSPMR